MSLHHLNQINRMFTDALDAEAKRTEAARKKFYATPLGKEVAELCKEVEQDQAREDMLANLDQRIAELEEQVADASAHGRLLSMERLHERLEELQNERESYLAD